jgi:DNA-directed RNA polymerase subunit RPC12/RpoP
MKTRFTTQRIYTRSGGTRTTFGDFVCMNCRSFVSAEAALSGVHNRNHCPYCLSSRHLDLYEAGDRLSACKARMKAVALTLKQTVKKYARPDQGELMLVHVCEDCGKVSINRIAADDDNEKILSVFQASSRLDQYTHRTLAEGGIAPLGMADMHLVTRRLFGQN